jgi:hypothetical protein
MEMAHVFVFYEMPYKRASRMGRNAAPVLDAISYNWSNRELRDGFEPSPTSFRDVLFPFLFFLSLSIFFLLSDAKAAR